MPVSQSINIQPKSILVITLRYLGDALLVTPLISSLKQAYPDAKIDVLLPCANLGMLEGNPDINRLIPTKAKLETWRFVKLLLSLFHRYDLSISTQAGDRPTLCAVLAGKVSMGFVLEKTSKYSWKRYLLNRYLEINEQQSHVILENLRFCQLLNIAPCYVLKPPRDESSTKLPTVSGRYAVLHIMPQWRYKQWPIECWLKVGYYLKKAGLTIVLTGSNQPAELDILKDLQRRLPPSTMNLAGKLSLPALTAIIEKAAIFIGPDTGITHLAAATGVCTVAIFGPTNPERWAPWPIGYAKDAPPFIATGTQKKNNVVLVQGAAAKACVPCQQEGCDKNRQSRSDCLDELSAEKVIAILRPLIETDDSTKNNVVYPA